MFFYIGEKSPYTAMTQVNPGLFLDDAWIKEEVSGVLVWYKGYSTDCILAEAIPDILKGYAPAGKWCAIVYDSSYKLLHSTVRPFPVYQRGDEYTNIQIEGFSRSGYYSQPVKTFTDSISIDYAAELIGDILYENIVNFYKYNQIDRLNVLFTGGIDSMTNWAILDSVRHDYNLDIYVPKYERDNSLGITREVTSDLITKLSQDYWGYRVSSTYKKSCWYMTGYYSERMQIREVSQLVSIAHYFNVPVIDFAVETDYLYWFMRRPGKSHMAECENEASLREFCFNTCYNDHQMWHLNNNFHFSPFFDLRIAEICNQLTLLDIIKNGMNAITQRKIIERFRPEFIQILSDYKNSKDVFSNFRKNFKNIILDPEITLKLR